jgi:DNA ligase D-like protein (predicted 3'-phosphoesterase)|tara:strand:- start:255 stop:761 length:507 start_codon:yes stop_codon:yes gene_type:complete
MSLKEYNKKRDLKKSGEPRGASPPTLPKSEKLIFCVQKHQASHLHWDLRLEMNGVLKSWAVPKEPPTIKGVKRLAIQVEDHPLSYAKFEGEIKEGYGAGTVKIWDKGKYELGENAETPRAYPETFFKKMFTKGKIEIILYGKKLKGNYVLIKTNYGNKPEKSWLFFKV